MKSKENNRICSKCKVEEVVSIDSNQWYCPSCRKEYNKAYNNTKQGHFLYMIMNNDVIQYIGKASRIDNRISSHINCHSSNTKHIFEQGKWTEIKVLDVTGVVIDDIELRVLENELINLYKPSNNDITNTSYLLHNSRLFELMSDIHSRRWISYKINSK